MPLAADVDGQELGRYAEEEAYSQTEAIRRRELHHGEDLSLRCDSPAFEGVDVAMFPEHRVASAHIPGRQRDSSTLVCDPCIWRSIRREVSGAHFKWPTVNQE